MSRAQIDMEQIVGLNAAISATVQGISGLGTTTVSVATLVPGGTYHPGAGDETYVSPYYSGSVGISGKTIKAAGLNGGSYFATFVDSNSYGGGNIAYISWSGSSINVVSPNSGTFSIWYIY